MPAAAASQAVMQGFAGALVKSHCRRPLRLGRRANITVTGELRFDQPIPVTQPEEGLFLDVIARLFAVQDPPLVIVIPRAPERFGLMADALAARGLTAVTRTSLLDQGLGLKASGSAHALRAGTVFLGDSLGEMYFYLELSDRVVVGGGFQPKGSHNIIEPLALGKPVIVGPEIHTIEYPAVEAIAAGVCLQTTAEALARDIETWPDPTPRAISAYIDAHSGAGARTMAAIAPLL
jgi:3-deoxy-D-manno-octulosonic-acid transferase